MLLTSAAPALADRGCVGRLQPSGPKPLAILIAHPVGTSTHLQNMPRPRLTPRTELYNLTPRGTLATPRELAGAGREGQSVNRQPPPPPRRRTGATQTQTGGCPGRSRIDRPQTPGIRKWTQVPFHESLHECSSSRWPELARLAPISTFSPQSSIKNLVKDPLSRGHIAPIGGGFVLA